MSIGLLNKLVPQSVALDSVSGGKTEITSSDVAAALGFGNLSPAACNYGLAKYCASKLAANELMAFFNDIIKKQVKTEQWTQGLKSTEGLAQLMMLEGVYGVHCNKCKGRGIAVHCKGGRGISKDCEKCHGTGLGAHSERRRAGIANISSSSWDRHWKLRLNSLLVCAYELEEQLHRHLKYQFHR